MGNFVSQPGIYYLDEWSDLSKRRFLRLTARCLHDGHVKTYFLSLNKIVAIHLNSTELNNIFNQSLDKYSIRFKVMSAVSDNCNLMKNSFTHSEIIRFPCACHLINNLLKAFLSPSEIIIQEISSACKCIKTSVCYTALKEDFDEPKLISYTEIRWISLYESLKSLQQSKKSIETFYVLEEHANNEIRHKLTLKHWEFIEKILPIMKVYNKVIKIIESDDFGKISFVLSSFYKIKVMIESLPKNFFYDNILNFKSSYSEKMNEFREQLHPLYDACSLLNPFISKENVNIQAGIEYIQNHMKCFGWKPEKTKNPQNKTLSFFSLQTEESISSTTIRGPVHKLLDLEVLTPDLGVGNALFKFWKDRLDNGVDTELAKVAIGLLNMYCTSCSAERLFSTAGRVLTRERMKLIVDAAESQIIIMANKELADKYCSFE